MKLVKLPDEILWVKLETERDLVDIDLLLKLPATVMQVFTTPLPRKIVVLYQGKWIGFDYSALDSDNKQCTMKGSERYVQGVENNG